MNDLDKQIAEFMRGTCNTVSRAAAAFDVDEDRVTEALALEGLVNCDVCGWWADESDMSEGVAGQICPDCGDC